MFRWLTLKPIFFRIYVAIFGLSASTGRPTGHIESSPQLRLNEIPRYIMGGMNSLKLTATAETATVADRQNTKSCILCYGYVYDEWIMLNNRSLRTAQWTMRMNNNNNKWIDAAATSHGVPALHSAVSIVRWNRLIGKLFDGCAGYWKQWNEIFQKDFV